jgi:hypothetical protein
VSSTIYCDHCGQPCKASLRPEWYRCGLHLPKGNFAADLCPNCLDELLAFIGYELLAFIGRSERYAQENSA